MTRINPLAGMAEVVPNFSYSYITHHALIEEELIKLSSKRAMVLEEIIQSRKNNEPLITSENLMRNLSIETANALYVIIFKLREKIEANPSEPEYLKSVRYFDGLSVQRGYYFGNLPEDRFKEFSLIRYSDYCEFKFPNGDIVEAEADEYKLFRKLIEKEGENIFIEDLANSFEWTTDYVYTVMNRLRDRLGEFSSLIKNFSGTYKAGKTKGDYSRFGDLKYLATGELEVDGMAYNMPSSLFDIFTYLVENEGKEVAFSELEQKFAPTNSKNPKGYVYASIFKLREKFKEIGTSVKIQKGNIGYQILKE